MPLRTSAAGHKRHTVPKSLQYVIGERHDAREPSIGSLFRCDVHVALRRLSGMRIGRFEVDIPVATPTAQTQDEKLLKWPLDLAGRRPRGHQAGFEGFLGVRALTAAISSK